LLLEGDGEGVDDGVDNGKGDGIIEDTGADAPGVLMLSGWPFSPYVFTACTVTD
jgi:hypothetical protein